MVVEMIIWHHSLGHGVERKLLYTVMFIS